MTIVSRIAETLSAGTETLEPTLSFSAFKADHIAVLTIGVYIDDKPYFRQGASFATKATIGSLTTDGQTVRALVFTPADWLIRDAGGAAWSTIGDNVYWQDIPIPQVADIELEIELCRASNPGEVGTAGTIIVKPPGSDMARLGVTLSLVPG